jgi:hypothetical protein
METHMDNDKRATWERYAAAWKAATREAKQAALAASTAPTVTYRDPLTVAESHAALVDYMIAFHAQVPGGWFSTTYFLAHHDRSIAKWDMIDDAGAVIGHGVSYGEYNTRGELVAIVGFFDAPPAA